MELIDVELPKVLLAIISKPPISETRWDERVTLADESKTHRHTSVTRDSGRADGDMEEPGVLKFSTA